MSAPIEISRHRCFGGEVGFYRHASAEIGGEMKFSVFVPDGLGGAKAPALLYLAGLTCTEETFIVKAGAQQHAAKAGYLLVAPDTSPRDRRHPGDDSSWDFGLGAGFYLDATAEPWREGYRMGSYVSSELPAVIEANFPADPARWGVFGHSMGGHGALVTALRHPDKFRSVSAFAPIVAPSTCPWGEKAFSNYLGPDRKTWAEWDATALVESGRRLPPILIDQGLKDQFLERELHPHLFEAACAKAGQKLTLRRHEGYDHGYYFIQTFVGDHIAHHKAILG
ncbi:S-formylglutathione hydrolase [Methylocapsa palsarum]|uniref:S-formylglutathione hydrolase n=1 Tax=Methylocapsa palsarum TaxID=1612308 RepID=A0A1I4AIF3_9HYPH|nr:S-formylglutathione hydrolase [Methylocapsa palsarum]SFK56144.1 S-formylglutathione hydrolase [Methylocapsa palsarum]